MTLTPGQKVRWLYVPRGGYGYIHPVDAEVVRVLPSGRVTIDVRKTDGTPKRISVKSCNLVVKEASK